MDVNQYKYIGFLPYSYDNDGKLLVLLGKQAIISDWSESGKLSDFGGTPNKDESILYSAVRECFEETMGILGC